MIAVWENNSQIIDLLLKHKKCDVFKRNNNANTAFDLAVMNNYDWTIQNIYDYMIRNNVEKSKISQLINKERVNETRRPYIAACESQKKRTIRLLVNYCKVDVTLKSKHGKYGSEYYNGDEKFKQWLVELEKSQSNVLNK